MVGLKYHGKAQAGELPQLWESINQRMDEIQALDADALMAFGISSMDADFPQTMEFEYIVGFPVRDAEQEQPKDMVRFTLRTKKNHAGSVIYLFMSPNAITIDVRIINGGFNPHAFQAQGRLRNPPLYL